MTLPPTRAARIQRRRRARRTPDPRIGIWVECSRPGCPHWAARRGAGTGAVPDWYVDAAWSQAARDRIVKTVREFHHAHPLLPGIPKQDLRSRELPGAPPALFEALLTGAKELLAEGENVRLRSHKVVLQADEEQARSKIEDTFQQAGLAVPAVAEVLAKSGVDAARGRNLVQILLREKRLVRISDDLVFHQSAMESLKALLAVHRGSRFGVGAFEEWTGISRKYAIPLLEFLDRERVTRRDGDQRVVL